MKINSDFKLPTLKGFIVVEGLNGAGKTTLISLIKDFFNKEDASRNVLLTRECGSPHSAVCRELASIVKHGKVGEIQPRTEAFLFATDRAQHRDEVILPAIARGEIVINDRYFYSSIAFQAYGRGLDPKWVHELNMLAIEGNFPDFVILLDISPEDAHERLTARNHPENAEKDRMEVADIEFHRRVRKGFLTLAESELAPTIVLDAKNATSDLLEKIKPLLRQYLKR